MDPFSLSASVIAVLQISGIVISTLYEYRAGVASASKDAARIIAELNSLRSVLESLLSTIESEESTPPSYSSKSLPPSASSTRLATITKLAQPDGELQRCQSELEKLGRKLRAKDESKLARIQHALTWPLKKDQVDSALENLQRAKTTMSLALATDQVVLSLEVQKQVSNLAELFATSELDKRKSEIRAWLAPPNPFTNHGIARKKKQGGTGEWFLKGKMFEHWREREASFLWIYGIPGCGKSILCSSIIEDVSRRCIAESSVALAFYYFDFNDLGQRDIQAMAQALVAQLVAQLPNKSKSLEMLYDHVQRGVQQPDSDFLARTLKYMVQAFQHTYIIIDALDECSEYEEVLGFIELSEIEEVVGECATDRLCLQDSKIRTDIVMLIQHRLDTDKKFLKWPLDVRQEIQRTLTEGANGMFRWVYCQLEILRNCVTLHALRKALGSLPKTLDDTYDRILSNIDESYASEVKKILQYLAFCQWPPTLAEMVEVLAIDWDGDEPNFEVHNRIPDPKDILNMCSSLVTTFEGRVQHLGEKKVSGVPTLRLAHFSVVEYITSSRIQSSKASMYFVSPLTSNLFITSTYIAYLMQPEFSSGHIGWKPTLERFKRFPLTNTAAQLWPTQLRLVTDRDDNASIDPSTEKLILKFFETKNLSNGGNFASWVGALIPDSPSYLIASTPPLYYCASYGLTPLVRLILENMPKDEIDAKGGRAFSSPLHVAVFRGKFDCVKLLLEAGADPNSANSRRESCLFWARGKMRRDIYQLLVKYGAVERKQAFESKDGVTAEDMRMEVIRRRTERGDVKLAGTRQAKILDWFLEGHGIEDLEESNEGRAAEKPQPVEGTGLHNLRQDSDELDLESAPAPPANQEASDKLTKIEREETREQEQRLKSDGW